MRNTPGGKIKRKFEKDEKKFLKEFEKGAGKKELKQAFPAELVDSLIKRINANKHKR